MFRYVPKRSPFDKTSFIEDFIPRQIKYHKDRKPRLPQWDDPNYVWPRLLPAPTQSKGKLLIREVEREEQMKIDLSRNFDLPDFRTGDVIQFHYYHSLSEGKGNTYTGLVVNRRNPYQLSGRFDVIFRFCGVEVYMGVKQYSPFLSNFKLVQRGSGNLRKHLYYLWEDRTLTLEQTRTPLKKGKAMRRRKGDVTKKQVTQRIPKNLQMDEIVDPLLSKQAQ